MSQTFSAHALAKKLAAVRLAPGAMPRLCPPRGTAQGFKVQPGIPLRGLPPSLHPSLARSRRPSVRARVRKYIIQIQYTYYFNTV